jgi:hypothetical protein
MPARKKRTEVTEGECASPYCTRAPYYSDGLCRDCHERLMCRQFRKQLWAAKVRRGTTIKSIKLEDDAEARW